MANNKYGEKYTRELLTEAVANSISIVGVLRYLEIPMAGGTHAHISRKLTPAFAGRFKNKKGP